MRLARKRGMERAGRGKWDMQCRSNTLYPPPISLLAASPFISSRSLYVIFRLPKLQFLDSSPVTPEERKEAAAKGQYLAVRKPKQKSTSTLGKPVSPTAMGGVFGAL